MNGWLLVLTILWGTDDPARARGASMQSVGPFATYQACINAGNKWGEVQVKSGPAGFKFSALCVRQTTPAKEIARE